MGYIPLPLYPLAVPQTAIVTDQGITQDSLAYTIYYAVVENGHRK